ncbi:MAG TPA: SLBB domain-containing protein, partial [Gammaproteobacteria bacterium]
ILRGEDSADLTLQAHDHLSISTIPEWNSEWTVTLEGEVRFPGEYRVRRGETLRQVLERAGGLTDEAFPEGSVFLRESLREREQDQIDLTAKIACCWNWLTNAAAAVTFAIAMATCISATWR